MREPLCENGAGYETMCGSGARHETTDHPFVVVVEVVVEGSYEERALKQTHLFAMRIKVKVSLSINY